MFIKGMKYEFRAVARIVMPMLIILLAAAMLMSATFVLDGRVFHFSDVMDSAAETSSAQDLIAILFVTFEMILGMGLYFLFLAIIIAVSILVIYRFYVSFFTDEGYLTFTLPVGRHQLLNAKLISGTSLLAATVAVLFPSLLLMLAIGFGDYVFTPEFFRELGEALSAMWETVGAWSILYAAELILLGLLPAAALLGSILVILADLLGRVLVAPSELPVGILLSLVGGPYFLILLVRRKRHAGI